MRRANPPSQPEPGTAAIARPGFLRRMGAVIYDALLLLAVLFLATALALPFNGGEAFAASQVLYPIYLLAVSFAFYGWFWTHGGQTLGLKAWKIKVVSANAQPVGWPQATLRFFSALLSWACLGLGFLWCLFDKDRQAWHDRLSKTRVVYCEEKR
ncbi:RDD family protein [Methylomonas sp. HW2-6]|uniref:RDD family protein n=1 Tax=Methylomonas sp. HW2-6 TaxID=3376687 RepID=UPI004042D01A